LTTGDVNGDGALDLVITNWIDNTVTVLLGNGDGNFIKKNDYSASGPVNTSIVDLNSDGKLDLVASNGVLLGNGDGTFQPLLVSPTGLFPATVGDFNHDGKPDLATLISTGSFPSGSVSILIGKGDGTFQPPVDYPAALGLGLATGDFRGNGKLDLAIPDYEIGAVSVLLGNGDGTFQPQVIYSLLTPANPQPNSIAVSDLNGDGKLDIIVASGIGISILFGNGDGTFKPHVDFPISAGASDLAVADFNKDGKPDLATLSGGGIAILLGNGDGTFKPAVTYPAPANMAGPLVAADFNLDGKLDLGGLGQNGVDIVFGNGDGTFQTPGRTYANAQGGQGLIVADFDRDGALDLATGTAVLGLQPTISVFLNAPVVAVSPNRLSFAATSLGMTSPTQTILVSNPGLAPLKIQGISASGDFAQSNTCPVSPAALAFGGNCTINVTFTPKANGTRTGAVTITDNAPGSPQTVPLVGNLPVLSLLPATLTYTPQLVGTKNSAQMATLMNAGSAAINITEIEVGGPNSSDFAESNTCSSILPASASCVISVTFTPSDRGSRTATVTVFDDASNSPQTLSLAGTGIAPLVSLSVSSIAFPNQLVNTTSSAKQFMLTNTGDAALTVANIAASGDFAQTNNCGTSVGIGASCTVNVTFTPALSGMRSGAVTINDNAAGNPQMVSLTGTGIAPIVALGGASLSFGGQIVGGTSGAQMVSLSNTGTAPLTIAGIAITGTNSGDFAQTNTCGGSLAVATNCTISVTFTPTATGTRTASVSITDNATGSPQTVPLTATGLDFSMTSPAPTATVTAGQTATYSVSVSPEGGFNQTVSFTCAGAPSQSTCNAAPTVVTLNGASATSVTIVVSTTAPAMLFPHYPRTGPQYPDKYRPLALVLVLLALALMASLFKQGRHRRHSLATALLLALIICAGLSLAACAGGGSSKPGTPAGTYSLAVTGTFASGSTTLAHSAKLTLVVQ